MRASAAAVQARQAPFSRDGVKGSMRWAVVPGMWGSLPLPEFMGDPNRINGRYGRYSRLSSKTDLHKWLAGAQAGAVPSGHTGLARNGLVAGASCWRTKPVLITQDSVVRQYDHLR
jgi:hypothetical protein